MNDQLSIPEGLSKKERKLFKHQWYHQQHVTTIRTAQFKKYTIIGAIALALGLGGYWMIQKVNTPLPGQYIPSLGNKHIETVDTAHDPYNSLPPTSGPHLGGKANWGISQSPIPDELQIHNLEDGGVMVQYNCLPGKSVEGSATPSAQETNDCKQLIDQLAAIVKKYQEKVVLAPYPSLDTKIALTAWTRIDKFNDFDAERVEEFIKAFQGIDHHIS